MQGGKKEIDMKSMALDTAQGIPREKQVSIPFRPPPADDSHLSIECESSRGSGGAAPPDARVDRESPEPGVPEYGGQHDQHGVIAVQEQDNETEDTLPEGWEERKSQEGRVYFIDHNTKSTTWVRPGVTSVQEQDNETGNPLPEGWEEQKTQEGRAYFVNHITKSTTWVRPCVTSVEEQDNETGNPLPEGWEEQKTQEGRVYFVNHITKSTSWVRPGLLGVAETLPEGWEAQRTREGKLYHVNHIAKSTSWNHPLQESPLQTSGLYQPLNIESREIRLVTIKPIRDATGVENLHLLECELSTVSLDTRPDYVALSYAWGDQGTKLPVFMNGELFFVTKNLHAALLQLRICCTIIQPFGPVWIDAICIDQGNPQEKNYQLPLMREIYESAAEVFVWLGEDKNDDGGKAFGLMNRWVTAIKEFRGEGIDGQSFEERWRNNASKLLVAVEDPFNEEDWLAVSRILQWPYWERIWTVQEIVVAREPCLFCGSSIFALDDLFEILPVWFSLGNANFNNLLSLAQFRMVSRCPLHRVLRVTGIRLSWLKGEKRMDFLNLLKMTSAHHATNPRDKLYAVLGLVAKPDIPIVPDYTLPVSRVYVDNVVSYTLLKRDLSMIACAGVHGTPGRHAMDLPSWVPDFSKPGWGQGSFLTALPRAGGRQELDIKFSDDCKEFSAKGLVCGIIDLALDIIAPADHPTANTKVILPGCFSLGILLALQNVKKFHPSGTSWLHAYFYTLTAGQSQFGSVVDSNTGGNLRLNLLEDVVGFFNVIEGALMHLDTALSDPQTGLRELIYTHIVKPGDEWKLRGRVGAYLEKLLKSSTENFKTCESESKAQSAHQESTTRSELTVITSVGKDGRPCGRPDEPVNSITQRNAICMPTFEDFVEDFLENESPELQVDWPVDFVLRPRFNCDARFYKTVQQYAEDRMLIRTKEGYIGSAPSETQQGDFIVILLECKVPLVIRRCERHYVLIGACYVYGMMDGEVTAGVENSTVFLPTFKFL
jgi:hypothetical protein